VSTVVVRVPEQLWREVLQLKKHLQVPMSLSKAFDLWPRCPACNGLLVRHISDPQILACPRCGKQYTLSPLEATPSPRNP
jgi:uncharacterized protein with PIN domain